MNDLTQVQHLLKGLTKAELEDVMFTCSKLIDELPKVQCKNVRDNAMVPKEKAPILPVGIEYNAKGKLVYSGTRVGVIPSFLAFKSAEIAAKELGRSVALMEDIFAFLKSHSDVVDEQVRRMEEVANSTTCTETMRT